jgi:hypothetical protein
MPNKSYGILSLTASLALGVVVGAAAALLLTPTPLPSTNWGVYVGPLPNQLSFDPVRMGKTDTVHWAATTSSKNLAIETEQKIFVNSVQQPNGRYRVRCGGDVCDSGPVVSVPPPPQPPEGYKYWQGLADLSMPNNYAWADGRIIIKW